jgi:putative ABC transport system substrate-binding protein
VRRREFITLLGGAACAWPIAARAQQAGKLPTIGFLGSVSVPAAQGRWVAAFLQRLRELGWTEGRNFVIEYRWAEGSSDRAAEFAGDIGHPDCLRGDSGPGWHRSRREFGSPGRERHRTLGPAH